MTPRDTSRPTDGDSGALAAHLLGRSWLAWQRGTADLIGEASDDGFGYRYPTVVVLVPRQTGKTTFAFDLAMGRCIDQRDYRAAYTAQTGHVTSERFGERMAEVASAAILARRVKRRRSAGTERMSFPASSYVKAFPPKDGSLRGSALDLVQIDEAQEIDELLGRALDQTVLPVFTTRPRRQLFLIGTAGTDMSAYLARYLAMARGGADGVAVIEYGATADDDWEDPRVWHRVHPGLAAGLTDESALRAALQIMGPELFAREYLCVWVASGDRIIPAKGWNACRRVGATPSAGVPPVLAVDVAIDRSASAILAVWPDRDGVPVGEVVEYRPGVDWAAPRLIEIRHGLIEQRQSPMIVADSQGPVLTVVDELTRAGVEVTQPTTRELSAACASTLDRVLLGTVAHRGEQALDQAAAGAAKRSIGDGWVWGRRSSTADVCPLVAYSLALWGDQRRPAPPVRPVAAHG